MVHKVCSPLCNSYFLRLYTSLCALRLHFAPHYFAPHKKRSHSLHLTFRASNLCTLALRPHIYTFVHTYIHIYKHTPIHTYTHTYIHTHAYMHTYTYIHTYIHTNIHTYTHTQMHTNIHIYIYICTNLVHAHFLHTR